MEIERLRDGPGNHYQAAERFPGAAQRMRGKTIGRPHEKTVAGWAARPRAAAHHTDFSRGIRQSPQPVGWEEPLSYDKLEFIIEINLGQ
jgi:hypothetical protein